MKKVTAFLASICLVLAAFSQSVAINNEGSLPHPSAVLDISSINKGILVPRMNSAERSAISSAATGLIVFDNTTSSFWFKSATNWVELVDTSNNVWKKNATHIYTTGNTQVGIGVSAPAFDLHIKQPGANIGLTDETTNKVSATFAGNDGDLVINSYRSSSNPGNIILQRSNAFPVLNAGNVGIGVPFTSAPTAKLQVQGGATLGISANSITGGMFQLGSTTSVNLALDNDEIQGRNNGDASDITLQKEGGHILIDKYTKLKRNNADMLPLSYGVINSNGSIISGTGNFTATRLSEGKYRIFLTGSGINEDNAVTIVTPFMTTSEPRFASINYYLFATSSVDITLSPVGVNGEMDGKFAFIIYRL